MEFRGRDGMEGRPLWAGPPGSPPGFLCTLSFAHLSVVTLSTSRSSPLMFDVGGFEDLPSHTLWAVLSTCYSTRSGHLLSSGLCGPGTFIKQHFRWRGSQFAGECVCAAGWAWGWASGACVPVLVPPVTYASAVPMSPVLRGPLFFHLKNKPVGVAVSSKIFSNFPFSIVIKHVLYGNMSFKAQQTRALYDFGRKY